MTNVLQMFDTVKLSEDGAWLHLNVPCSNQKAYADKEKKKPLRIKMKGPDCNKWSEFKLKSQRAKPGKNGKVEEKSISEIALDDAKLLASLALEFQNIPDASGKSELPCTYENAIKLYLDYKDIRVQALSMLFDQENFMLQQEKD